MSKSIFGERPGSQVCAREDRGALFTVALRLGRLVRDVCENHRSYLHKKEITLLSPETWEDRNDAYYLEYYRDERKLRSVLAICFSMCKETFHHWRVFSDSSSGVCIEFDKDKLLRAIPANKAFRHGAVSYQWISELHKKKPPLESWRACSTTYY